MTLDTLIANPNFKNKKRKGRGISAGQGKTCGRGQKGQHSRAGFSRKKGFEGGQMPLYLRIPKYGFTSQKNNNLAIVNLGKIQQFYKSNELVSIKTLMEKRLIRSKKITRVKILASGLSKDKIDLKIIFDKNLLFSRTAKALLKK